MHDAHTMPACAVKRVEESVKISYAVPWEIDSGGIVLEILQEVALAGFPDGCHAFGKQFFRTLSRRLVTCQYFREGREVERERSHYDAVPREETAQQREDCDD